MSLSSGQPFSGRGKRPVEGVLQTVLHNWLEGIWHRSVCPYRVFHQHHGRSWHQGGSRVHQCPLISSSKWGSLGHRKTAGDQSQLQRGHQCKQQQS